VSSNPVQYTGRENEGTGLYYYRARYYHPGLARFIGEDPIGFAGGDINLYAYALNRPTAFRDPSGLELVGFTYGAAGFAGFGRAGKFGGGAAATGSILTGLWTEGVRVLGQGSAASRGVAVLEPGESAEPSGAVIGGGGTKLGPGLFVSNATSFSELQGPFQTTILALPGLFIQYDWSRDPTGRLVFVLSGSLGFGLGIAQLETYTPPESTNDITYPCPACPVSAFTPGNGGGGPRLGGAVLGRRK